MTSSELGVKLGSDDANKTPAVKFVHLRTYTDYSLGWGAIKIKDLVKACLKHGYPAAAITDTNNLFGSLEYAIEAVKSGVQPIIGIDVSVQYGSADKLGNLLLLAKDQFGYENLLQIASLIYLKREDSQPLCIKLEDLISLNGGLIALGCAPKLSLEYKRFEAQEDNVFLFTQQMASCFDSRFYIELMRHDEVVAEDKRYENMVLEYAYANNLPIVATNSAAFLERDFYDAQDALNCIVAGRYLVEDDRRKLPTSFYFKSMRQMEALFADLPEALENSVIIAKRCHYFPTARPPLLSKFAPDTVEVTESELLAQEAKNGLMVRLQQFKVDESLHQTYWERLEFELGVINKMQYPGYFLIVSDFIRWSKSQGIPVGPGRGSGAGSIVAWALDITDLDPIHFGLLFERFLNPDRVSMPDFDIDFCQERRGEVIRYVQQKYGHDHVAQIITYGKLQARAVLRDVGRVLQMPYGMIDKICKMVPNNPTNPVTLQEAIELDKELKEARNTDPDIERLLTISLKLEGLNRHVSTHAAGIVIADRPIVKLAPLYLDSHGTMPAVQYSMKYAESAGLIKFDFLGLKTLTVIAWAVQMLEKQGIKLDINNIPLEDHATYELLSSGNTVGIFQFESAGMKEAIKRLKPDSIGDLIALGSLYRPGPMDNIPSYINRKHGLEQPTYLHPLAEPILKETYGIIVYQEQVMEIAKVLAGFSLGSADLLRRAMGKKIKAEMEAQREVFVAGCLASGIARSKAEEIFALIEKFASYGFNKSHAAAYAIISYQTAFLKANHIKEFLVASINSEIHDTDKINLFIEEAKKFSVPILLPDINRSSAMFCVEGEAIRFGLAAIKNVGVNAIENIIAERQKNGVFTNIYDLCERCQPGWLNKRVLEGLTLSGALDALEINRNMLLSSIEILVRYCQEYHRDKNTGQFTLFESDDQNLSYKPQLIAAESWSKEQALLKEFEAFGFYLSAHPVATYQAKLAKLGVAASSSIDVLAGNGKGVKITLAGVVVSRKVKSSKRGKYAFLQLSDQYGLAEICVFNEALLTKNNDLLQIGSIIYVTTDARKDENGLRVVVESVLSLTEAIKDVIIPIDVLITDITVMPKLIESFTLKREENTKVARLKLQLDCGSVITFHIAKPLYLTAEKECFLAQLRGVQLD
jgi:DNA polymerase-3 subunit alpha